MSQSEFPLYPNTTIITKIVKAKFHVYEYTPFESAKISVVLLDENDLGVKSKFYIIDTSNGFLEWTTDDYLVKWIKTKLQQEP